MRNGDVIVRFGGARRAPLASVIDQRKLHRPDMPQRWRTRYLSGKLRREFAAEIAGSVRLQSVAQLVSVGYRGN